MSTLEEIRAKLRQAEDKKNSGRSSGGDGLTYPHWDKSAPAGSTSVLRFLPDGNPDNTYFWKERQVIKLEFPGVKGGDVNKTVTIQVPCMEMWGEQCPVLQEIRPWFDGDAEQEKLARKYWKKRTYMFQGFVRDSAITEEEVPENPIRKFVIGPQIFGIIKAALLDPEMDSMPIDYLNGVDFRLTKQMKDKYANYDSSSWSRRESALTEEELEAIEKYGLVDLNTYLPEKPSPEALAVIFDMFEASVAGDLYDPVRWGKFYKPWGLEIKKDNSEAATATTQESTPAVTETATTADIPFEADSKEPELETAGAASAPNSNAQAILDKIRARDAE